VVNKSSKKTLDKSPKVWYNQGTKSRGIGTASDLGKAVRRCNSALTFDLEGQAPPLPPKKIKKSA
jgi:hypothetical protein